MITPADPQPTPADAWRQPSVETLFARLLPALLERHGEWLAVKDARTGRYVHVNAAMAAFLRRDAAQVIGHTDAELFDTTLGTMLRAAEQTALAQTEPLLSEHHFEWAGTRQEFAVLRLASPPAPDGTRWLCSVWADQNAARRTEAQFHTALRQLEEQQRANELLRREIADQAILDSASGLYTRAHFEDQLRREVDLSSREHREFSLVSIELDPPGEEVSAFGAAARTRILEALGRLLRGNTRAMDASCRLDESRFAVLLSGVGLATAHSRMEGLRRQCATQMVVLEGRNLGFTVSMGVASFPHTAHTQEALVEAAETALTEARKRGGNHVTLASIRFAEP